tara:strand:+ start:573 stop:1589 length:1017 start_codon:yes stop_codon:yes gene_type:complete
MKECKKGYYYCTKEKKCMPIPSGYRVGYGGWLMPDKKKNGKNGNGNGNGSHNGNGNGNGNGGGNGGGNGNGGGGGVSEGVTDAQLKAQEKAVFELEKKEANADRAKAMKKRKKELGEERIRLPLKLEIPRNNTEFNLGLMFRESLDYDRGMLFVFEEVGQKSFHMKDTRIPLDIAFITEDGVIESIKPLNPFTLLPVSSDGDVASALEVNRGWFAENNVEEGDALQIGNATGGLAFEVIDLIKPEPLVPTQKTVEWEDPAELTEIRRLPNYNTPGNILQVYLAWRGKTLSIQLFFPSAKKPSRKEVLDQLQKVYPGAKLWSYQVADYDPESPLLQTGS